MSAGVSVRIESMRYPDDESTENLIEDLEVTVQPNTVVSFLGSSGVGKTTLLRMIAGLEKRFEGQIAVDVHDVTQPTRNVQMVFQDYRLLPWKTVYGNIEFAARRKDPQADSHQVEKWLEIVKLKKKRNSWPKTLSGGEAGRVAFARAFVSSPQLLLLDEPFSNLDMVAKYRLQNELQEYLLIQETTVILVSHNIDDVVFLSDTIHVLSDQRMKIVKSFDVLADKPRQHRDPVLNRVYQDIIAYLEESKANGSTL